jgi:aconitate hydratase
VEVPVTCRLDTAEEVSIYEAGDVLQRFAKDFLENRGHASFPPGFQRGK